MHAPQRPTKPDTTPPATPRPEAVQLRARRSPRLIALGILLVVLGGLGAASLYTLNSDQRAVVVMAADVRRGDIIERHHLAVLEVPGTLGVESSDADHLTSFVGQHALSDLPKGTFPAARHFGTDPLPAGESLVGLRLALGKLPTSDMPLGTQVRLVGLVEGTESAVDAVVASRPQLLDNAASFSLDVRVADDSADDIARLAASDQVALIVVGVA